MNDFLDKQRRIQLLPRASFNILEMCLLLTIGVAFYQFALALKGSFKNGRKYLHKLTPQYQALWDSFDTAEIYTFLNWHDEDTPEFRANWYTPSPTLTFYPGVAAAPKAQAQPDTPPEQGTHQFQHIPGPSGTQLPSTPTQNWRPRKEVDYKTYRKKFQVYVTTNGSKMQQRTWKDDTIIITLFIIIQVSTKIIQAKPPSKTTSWIYPRSSPIRYATPIGFSCLLSDDHWYSLYADHQILPLQIWMFQEMISGTSTTASEPNIPSNCAASSGIPASVCQVCYLNLEDYSFA